LAGGEHNVAPGDQQECCSGTYAQTPHCDLLATDPAFPGHYIGKPVGVGNLVSQYWEADFDRMADKPRPPAPN
jgi:hypothetical protein